MVAVVGSAALFAFCCLGVGALAFMGSAGKPTTSGAVAKGKTDPMMPKDTKPITKSGDDTIPVEILSSKAIGVSVGGEPFEASGAQGTFLIGFAYKTRFPGDDAEIAYLQPIYWTPAGRKVAASGIGWPKDAETHPSIEAKDGYAIGGLLVWCNEGGRRFDLVRGIKVLFMRRRDQGLDPTDSYWSEWIGMRSEGTDVTLGGDGKAIVGIHGRAGGAINSLGIIQLR